MKTMNVVPVIHGLISAKYEVTFTWVIPSNEEQKRKYRILFAMAFENMGSILLCWLNIIHHIQYKEHGCLMKNLGKFACFV